MNSDSFFFSGGQFASCPPARVAKVKRIQRAVIIFAMSHSPCSVSIKLESGLVLLRAYRIIYYARNLDATKRENGLSRIRTGRVAVASGNLGKKRRWTKRQPYNSGCKKEDSFRFPRQATPATGSGRLSRNVCNGFAVLGNEACRQLFEREVNRLEAMTPLTSVPCAWNRGRSRPANCPFAAGRGKRTVLFVQWM